MEPDQKPTQQSEPRLGDKTDVAQDLRSYADEAADTVSLSSRSQSESEPDSEQDDPTPFLLECPLAIASETDGGR
jgi:hypothetical protein